jgi:nitroreductase
MDLETVDQLLTTTRSVRKRLDFARPVEPEVIERCLEIAIQAPSGSDRQSWHFIVITEPEVKFGIAELYRAAFNAYIGGAAAANSPTAPRNAVRESAIYLAERMHEAPALVLFCYEGRVERSSAAAQAALYGSILPAAWSFMLALRARGIGSAWTTLHMHHERAAAELLGLPEHLTQAVLIPLAYYTGDDFRPAKRASATERTSWNTWGRRRESAPQDLT